MSEENKTPDSTPDPKPDRFQVQMGYAKDSQVSEKDGAQSLDLHCNLYRTPVSVRGKLKEPILIREALSAMYEIVSSDFRYVPKDRTAYLAYRNLKKQSATMEGWQARQAYFDWLLRNDPLAFIILDPIITVHPDEIFLEVFSKDEGTYAKLSIDWDALEVEGKPSYGTTNIDFSSELYDGIQRLRSYRDTWLDIQTQEVKLESEKSSVIEKKIQVPHSWIRGFLQVQSAATLPCTTIQIQPIDLYNTMRQLRLNADQKKGGRAIRVELVPGEYPRLVLEPWEKVLVTKTEIYRGKIPQVVRVWGRRRLMLLHRMLPFVKDIRWHLMGSGMPSFMELQAGPVKLLLGMTGFTASNWSKSACFDLLLPRDNQANKELDKVLGVLQKDWKANFEELRKKTKLKGSDITKALQQGCQQGNLIFDLEHYRLRPLLDTPLPMKELEFRNDCEKVAHDLLAKKAVQLEMENRVLGSGTELTGTVTVKSEKREYRTQLFVDEEGQVRRADCTCSLFRQQGLKQGPCSHIVALRLFQAIEEMNRKGKQDNIEVETRTYSRRNRKGEEIFQISLQHKRLKKRWGLRGEDLRSQNLIFNSVEEAREAFFKQVQVLETKKYMDTTN